MAIDLYPRIKITHVGQSWMSTGTPTRTELTLVSLLCGENRHSERTSLSLLSFFFQILEKVKSLFLPWSTRNEKRKVRVFFPYFFLPESIVEIPSSLRKQEKWAVSIPSPHTRLSTRFFQFWTLDLLRLDSPLTFPPGVCGLVRRVNKRTGSEEGRERNAELGEGEYLFSGHHCT